MGHEYVGTVVEVGDEVTSVKVGDFVVGSFCISDNTCEICEDGFQSRCANGGAVRSPRVAEDSQGMNRASGRAFIIG